MVSKLCLARREVCLKHSQEFFPFLYYRQQKWFCEEQCRNNNNERKIPSRPKKFLIRYSQFCVIVSKADQCDTIVNFKHEDEKIVDFL